MQYMAKDISSRKDKEYRAIIIAEKQGKFIDMPVELNTLLDGVVVHPHGDLQAVQSKLDNKGVKLTAAKSKFHSL